MQPFRSANKSKPDPGIDLFQLTQEVDDESRESNSRGIVILLCVLLELGFMAALVMYLIWCFIIIPSQ